MLCYKAVLLFRNEDDSGEGSVPELVSADECDTSSDESESQSKPDMPALLDEEASDSNESGIDEVWYAPLLRIIFACMWFYKLTL